MTIEGDDEKTPLELLDEAVQQFVNTHPDYAGTLLTGWALGFQVSGHEDDSAWWDTSYATGVATNPATAVGILHLATAKSTRDLIEDDEGDGS